MVKLRFITLVAICAISSFTTISRNAEAGKSTVYSGDYIKTLKDKLKLKDTANIETGTADPSSSAVDAPKGSLYLRQGTTGEVYVKQDDGSSTNWEKVSVSPDLTSKLENIAEDTTPQLGGNLDVNGNSIVSASNGDIVITPNGTGNIAFQDGSEGTIGDVWTSTTINGDGAWVAIPPPAHNDTTSLQGGTTSEYYHLTSAEHTALTGLTASRAVVSNGSGDLASATTTATEIGYVNGVTSAIQTQLNAKLDDFSGTTDNVIMRTDGTGGDAVQESGISIDDSDNVAGVANLTMSGDIDTSSAAALDIAPSTATSVNLADTGVTSTVKGPLNVDEGASFDSTALFDGQITVSDGNEGIVGSIFTQTATDGDGTWIENSQGPPNLIINNNGQFTLDRSQTADIQDWIDSGSGTASSITTTAAEIPLYPRLNTAIAIDLASGVAEYTRLRWQMPEALKNQKLELSWHQITDGVDTEGIAVVLYSYTASDFSTGQTAVTLGNANTSGSMYIGTFNGFQPNSFDATDADYYELRFVNNGDSSGSLYLNNVKVGPGEVNAGFAGWKQYTEAAGDFAVTGTGWTTVSATAIPYKTSNDVWRLKFNVAGTVSSASRTTFTVSMSGVTFKTLTNGHQAVSASLNVSGTGAHGIAEEGTDNLVLYHPTQTTTGYRYSGDVELDSIPTWATDSSVGYIGSNDVEYVSHDGTNIVYGPGGATIPTSTPSGTNETLDITAGFSNIQETDTFRLEIDRGNEGRWMPTGILVENIRFDGTNFIGATVQNTGGLVGIRRGKYREGVTTTWSGITSGSKWRVVKHRAGIPVGFGLATADNAGLVSKEVSFSLSSISSNNFTDGSMTGYRVGNMVTLQITDPLDHSAASNPSSASGLIPEGFRPSSDSYSARFDSSGHMYFKVDTAGIVSFWYREFDGTADSSRTNAGTMQITYLAD